MTVKISFQNIRAVSAGDPTPCYAGTLVLAPDRLVTLAAQGPSPEEAVSNMLVGVRKEIALLLAAEKMLVDGTYDAEPFDPEFSKKAISAALERVSAPVAPTRFALDDGVDEQAEARQRDYERNQGLRERNPDANINIDIKG